MAERLPSVGAALDEFIRDLFLSDRQSSALTYARLLRPLHALDLSINELSSRDITELAHDGLARGLKPNSISTTVYAARAFGNWCVEHHYLTENVARSVAKPPKRHPPHEYLEAAQVRRLFTVARDDTDRLILHVLIMAGLRAAELCSLKWAHVDQARGVLRVYGKGAKWREVWPGDEAIRLLAIKAHKDVRVFAFETDALRARLERLGKRAGFPVRPHLLRHTFAMQYLDASDGDAFSLQQLLGHATMDQTAYYVRSWRQRNATARAKQVDLATVLLG